MPAEQGGQAWSLDHTNTTLLLLALPLALWPALGSCSVLHCMVQACPKEFVGFVGKVLTPRVSFQGSRISVWFQCDVPDFFPWKLLFTNSNLNIPQRTCPSQAKILSS